MKFAILVICCISAMFAPRLAARDCETSESAFTILSTGSGFSWHGIVLSVVSYGLPGLAREAASRMRVPASPTASPVNFSQAYDLDIQPDTPSLVRTGVIRLSSNVPAFSRKFQIEGNGFEAADLSFCDRHQINLRCQRVTAYVSEGVFSMQCSLTIADPAAAINP